METEEIHFWAVQTVDKGNQETQLVQEETKQNFEKHNNLKGFE